ncbi:hypothetical protein FJQ98_24800 [Lysinibacillus agricola]|uniref:Uncharacterized protein n=1 Tax=Lysinibacillus agricola TaxID=2590012 RepID=A0ABX7AVM4_9BACI|nr:MULTISPECIES: hypothetical protein [Lysinibacillus]QQP12274.1 hypothetical protein FJQ98_24800 [Lysinibacillus agricola]
MNPKKITLYPKASDVFVDVRLACYFRPLLSFTDVVEGTEYILHVLGTDGLFCEEEYLNAENNFWGFRYIDGKYDFLGDLRTFGDGNVQDIYAFLQADFAKNKNYYMENKITVNTYKMGIQDGLNQLAKNFDVDYYADAFYSYEFTKYHYKCTGEFRHITELTEGWGHDDTEVLIGREEAQEMSEEFFMNLKWNVTHDYGIDESLIRGATERYRFMSIIGGGTVFILLKPKEQTVYLLEYFS